MMIPGKVALITGASAGIGKETALELAKRGCRLYITCHNMAKCNHARTEIISRTGNTKIFCREMDLASFKSIRSFVDKYFYFQ